MSSKDFKFGNQGGVRKKALTGLRQFAENDILIRLVLFYFVPGNHTWLTNAQKDILVIQKGLFILTNKYSTKRILGLLKRNKSKKT